MSDDVKKCQKKGAKQREKNHTCPNCGAKFPFPNKLRLHIKSHHSLANKCELCTERFNRFNELRSHMRHAHQIIHQCHLCAYSSSVKAEVRKHIVKCHENGVRCTVDGCTATVAYNRLRRHIREVHCNGDRESHRGSQSTDDDETTGDLQGAEESVSQHATNLGVPNSASEESAVSNNSSEKFIDSVENDDEVHEMHEDLSPSSQNALANSKLEAKHEPIVKDAGSSCNGNDSGENVRKRTESDSVKQLNAISGQAQNVPKMVAESDSKEVPFFIYTDGGEYKCRKCGKIFVDMNNSRRHWNRVHLRTYEERIRSKRYVCEFPKCDRRFSCPSKLQDHTSAAHTEEMPFGCETCRKKFRSRAQFAVHLKRYHLASIRDVPFGFTDGNVANSCTISDEAADNAEHVTKETEPIGL